jgi:hypothetical protein
VALLFLTASAIANEAVWRAFFERAAELQLQPAVAAAVAAAAQPTAPDAASLAAALGPGRTLHPDVGVFPPWAYPGYRVQHSLMAGADASSTAAAAAAVQKVTAAAAGTRGSPTPAASDSAALTFPAAAQARESGLLHAEIQRLLRQPSPVSSSATPVPKSSSPGQQGALWSAYTQPSTLRDALAAAGLPQPAAVLNSTVLMAQHTARAVQVDPARCAASLSAAHAGGQPPLFSVYVHTPVGQLLPASSLLSGCELRVRLNTTHGYAQHVLAEAEALLLWAALSDPLNTKFVFVSDSSIPLYPPQVRPGTRVAMCAWQVHACCGTSTHKLTHADCSSSGASSCSSGAPGWTRASHQAVTRSCPHGEWWEGTSCVNHLCHTLTHQPPAQVAAPNGHAAVWPSALAQV